MHILVNGDCSWNQECNSEEITCTQVDISRMTGQRVKCVPADKKLSGQYVEVLFGLEALSWDCLP